MAFPFLQKLIDYKHETRKDDLIGASANLLNDEESQ